MEKEKKKKVKITYNIMPQLDFEGFRLTMSISKAGIKFTHKDKDKKKWRYLYKWEEILGIFKRGMKKDKVK